MRRKAQIAKCDICYMIIELNEEAEGRLPVAWVTIKAVAGDGEDLGSAEICHRCWRNGGNTAGSMVAVLREDRAEEERHGR